MKRLWEVWFTPKIQLSAVDHVIMTAEVVALLIIFFFGLLIVMSVKAGRVRRRRERDRERMPRRGGPLGLMIIFSLALGIWAVPTARADAWPIKKVQRARKVIRIAKKGFKRPRIIYSEEITTLTERPFEFPDEIPPAYLIWVEGPTYYLTPPDYEFPAQWTKYFGFPEGDDHRFPPWWLLLGAGGIALIDLDSTSPRPNPNPQPMPEPATILLMAGGLAGLSVLAIRRRRRA